MFRISQGKSYAYGLHPESGGLKIVSLGRSSAGFYLRDSYFFPCGNGLSSRDIMPGIDLGEVAGFLDHGVPVVAAMPGEYISVRHFSFPRMPFKDPERAVIWELRLLTPGQDMLARALRLGTYRQKGGIMLDMLGVAVPRALAVDFYGRFAGAGIQLAAVEPEFIGLWYLLERTCASLAHDQYTAVAHMGKSGICLMLCRKKVIVLCRHIYLEAGGKGTDARRKISAALEEYFVRGKGGDIGAVYLCGEVDGFFPDRKTFAAGNLVYHLLEADLGNGETVPPGLAVAAGLALRGLTG